LERLAIENLVVDPGSTEAQPSLAEPPDTVNPAPFDRTSGRGSRPGVNTVPARSARRGTMSRLNPLRMSKLCADALYDCKCLFLLRTMSFQPRGWGNAFPVDGTAFLRWSCVFRALGPLPNQSNTGSVAARETATERRLSAGVAIARNFGSVLGAALTGTFAFEAGSTGRHPLGLAWIRTNVVFGPTGPFERSHDFVPIRARGARR
jgi:hypothetical protein